MDWVSCVYCEKFGRNFVELTCALMALVRPVLHRLLSSNETVHNTPKQEFWVQWSGLGAFVAKNSDATLFGELAR
jgi:hypothetical protein